MDARVSRRARDPKRDDYEIDPDDFDRAMRNAVERRREQLRDRRPRSDVGRPRAARRALPSGPVKAVGMFVPIGIDPQRLPADIRWQVCWLLNHLHWRYIMWRADEEGFVPVNAALRREFVTDPQWHHVWRFVTDERREGGQLVQCDHRAAPGKSVGYRLAPAFRATHAVVCDDDALNRKIARAAARTENNLTPVHRALREHFGRLAIDLDAAGPIVATMTPDVDSPQTPDEYRACASGLCERWAAGDGWFTVCDYGRVHTPLTSIDKRLRSIVSCDGEPLVGFDLANSQPLMLGFLLLRWFRGRDARRRMLADNDEVYCVKALRFMIDHPGVPADVREYLRVCLEGRFYESFGLQRDVVKRQWLPLLMRPNRFDGPLKREMASRYPNVLDPTRAMKARDHTRMAHALQSLESTIFIRRICGRLEREHPTIPVFTIHDSIYTTPAHSDVVRDVALAVFADDFGVVPLLRPC
jgi:hypothetical protein